MCSWILEKILYFIVAKRRQFIVPYFSVALLKCGEDLGRVLRRIIKLLKKINIYIYMNKISNIINIIL